MKKIFFSIIALMVTIAVSAQTKEYVDLGLPSKTLWATCNVGAEAPEELGDYFAWGETEPNKSEYEWTNYEWCDQKNPLRRFIKYCVFHDYGTPDNKRELESKDDAAYVYWGKEWCMPTDLQIMELINKKYTTTEFTKLNGVEGLLITSKRNGNSIFLPAAGSIMGGTRFGYGDGMGGNEYDGHYWCKTGYDNNTYQIQFLGLMKSVVTTFGMRWHGMSIRPVSKKKATTTSIVEVTDDQEASKSGKYISGGNLVIVKDGKKFNANGIEIK